MKARGTARAARSAAAAALLLASACSSERREAMRSVRAYNEAAIEAYRTGEVSLLARVATEREVRKVAVLVDLKKASGLVLESELTSLEITSVERRGPGAMRVGTRERWRYHDRALRPGVPAGRVLLAEMTIEYDFVRVNGTWKLDQARTVTNQLLEPRAGGAP